MREGWEFKKLSEISTNLDSKRIPITHIKRKKGNTPYYGASGIVDYVEGHIFDENLLLVSEDGANLLMRTYPIAFSVSGKTWVNNHAHVLRFENIYTQRFVEYYLNSIKLDQYVSGMAQPKLNQASLNNIAVPYPKLAECKRVVEILDKTFAVIDKAKANIEKNSENVKEFWESYAIRIFGNESQGWKKTQLGNIGKVCMCKRVFKEQTFPSGDIPFYKIGTFGTIPDAYISIELYKEYRKKFSFPNKGDILISASGTIGRRVKYDGEPAYFQDSNIVWIDNDESQILNDYLFYFYGVCKWQTTKGATINRLYNDNLKQLEIAFPSIEKQRAIVHQLDVLQSKTKQLENRYTQKLADLEELKKSILQKAFTGQLSSINSVAPTVTPFAKATGISTTDLHASIIAFALKKHQGKQTASTFGNVKAEKITNTVQYVLDIDLERNPYKDAAGPNDYKRLLTVQSRAAKAGIFSVSKRGEGYSYSLKRQAGVWIEKAKNCLSQQWNELERVIDLFIPLNTDQTEVVATVYAAWNNLLIDGKTITDEAIVHEARENWHPDKLKIPREHFFKSIDWLRRNNVIPKGVGKKVIAKI